MTIHDFKHEFDPLFIQTLQTEITNLENTFLENPTKKYLEYIVTLASHGKRIRPYNAALLYTIYKKQDWKDIQHILFGIELIHLMALVHDDIMDNSDTRHGVASLHVFIYNSLPQESDVSTRKETARSEAILIGDLLFAWAYKMFSKDQPDEVSWKIIHSLVEEVIIGQVIDVYNPIELNTSREIIEQKMLLKTARYTFTRPMLLGAACSQVNKNDTLWITDFGDSIGLLFQMQDDILDIVGKTEVIKKEPLSDIKNGIHTLISNFVVTHASREQKDLWYTWFGKKVIPNQKEVCDFLEVLKAFDFTKEYIREKERKALDALEKSSLSSENIDIIKSFLKIITERSY